MVFISVLGRNFPTSVSRDENEDKSPMLTSILFDHVNMYRWLCRRLSFVYMYHMHFY